MDSALTPREIQTRIRAGEDLEEVARVAGVPAAEIEGFAGPVIAEREHISRLAQNCHVRRRGEANTQRLLGEVVAAQLTSRGVDPELVHWDAWREEGSSWVVQASWRTEEGARLARFSFDPRGRFSLPADDQARELVGDDGQPRPTPQRRRRSTDPDAEPTVDLNDELALLRAVQDEVPLISGGEDVHELSEPADYVDAEFTQVDGLYDFASPHSEMDVLYEMLASFNEDSVNIYRGLTQPVTDQERGGAEQALVPPSATAPVIPPDTPEAAAEDSAGTTSAAELPQATEPGTHPAQQPGQDSLIADQSAQEADHEAEARHRRRKRASVPSWDEIMFGGPRIPE